MVTIFIPREQRPGETRVAATPESVRRMVKQGLEVMVERGAGTAAFYPDSGYEAAGGRLVDDAAAGWSTADAVFKVNAPEPGEGAGQRPGSLLVAFLAPYQNLDLVRRLADGGISSIAMELIPRITRAQSMDALSSQASIAGYKAVLIAAGRLGKYFPLLMTAAGTIPPARVVVMGAGVAGLQAIATARRLGAVVEVSDVRAVVKEQVESLGGKFIELPEMPSGEGSGGYAKEMGEEFLRRQRAIVKERIAASDVVITTALVPGRRAPVLVTADMVEGMRAGSIIVDLAVEQGGNCELSRPNEEVVHQGVLILGPSNLPGTLPHDASNLYARNVLTLFQTLCKKDGGIVIDTADEVIAGSLLTHGGKVHHGPTAALLEVPA
ncbi:MAG TPA: Re/Si-specific NAD(P)(+) transhydrogenase subunit alpha [Thermoanaerobaculia bacterium]|nr:Re/Si-specific NAD(P)(+) transhydrogenase subunit alpha [Thermoanaerobaculia bacterium]